MNAWSGVLVAAATVVAAAGLAKLRAPSGTAALLRPIVGRGAVTGARVLGGVEVVVGSAALLVGSAPIAAALAAAYLAFLAVSLLARRSGSSCGCFGESSSRPDLVHLALVTAGATAAAGAAVTSAGGLVALAADGGAGVATAASGLLAGAIAIVALTVVPSVRAAGSGTRVRLFEPTPEAGR